MTDQTAGRTYAAVDLGSNSFRLSVGAHDGRTMRVLESVREPVRLAAGLDASGELTEPAKLAALACLMKFRTMLAGFRPDAVRVVATSATSALNNAPAFLPRMAEAIGHPVEIISGEEEGRLIYMGVAASLAADGECRLVVDIGGGSTELILGHGLDIERVESFSVGTIKQSLSFFSGGTVDAQSFGHAVLSARSHFEDAAQPFRLHNWGAAYGASGTIRTLAEAIARNRLGDGRLTLAGLLALRERFIGFGHIGRIDMPGLGRGRASAIVGGLAILIGLMEELGIGELAPADAGLRMGVMWDLHQRSLQRDRRDASVRMLGRRFQVDEARAAQVAGSAAALYTQLHQGPGGCARLLYWSAWLHEVGMAVSHTGYHKHAAYMVEHADLPGFTAGEQETMGRLLLAQKGNLLKLGGALGDAGFARAVLALRFAILLMHARAGHGGGELRLRMNGRIEVEAGRAWLAAHPTLRYWIGKEQEWWDEAGIDLALKCGADVPA